MASANGPTGWEESAIGHVHTYIVVWGEVVEEEWATEFFFWGERVAADSSRQGFVRPWKKKSLLYYYEKNGSIQHYFTFLFDFAPSKGRMGVPRE